MNTFCVYYILEAKFSILLFFSFMRFHQTLSNTAHSFIFFSFLLQPFLFIILMALAITHLRTITGYSQNKYSIHSIVINCMDEFSKMLVNLHRSLWWIIVEYRILDSLRKKIFNQYLVDIFIQWNRIRIPFGLLVTFFSFNDIFIKDII